MASINTDLSKYHTSLTQMQIVWHREIDSAEYMRAQMHAQKWLCQNDLVEEQRVRTCLTATFLPVQ